MCMLGEPRRKVALLEQDFALRAKRKKRRDMNILILLFLLSDNIA